MPSECILMDREPINSSFSFWKIMCTHAYTQTYVQKHAHTHIHKHITKKSGHEFQWEQEKVWGDKEGRGKWYNYALKNIKKEFHNYELLKHI